MPGYFRNCHVKRCSFRDHERVDKRVADTHYVLGSAMGPHPFPTIVRDFQAVISKEIKEQILEKEGRLPDAVLACVGGGSNAIGTFYNFIEDEGVRLIGCEAAGRGINTAETQQRSLPESLVSSME